MIKFSSPVHWNQELRAQLIKDIDAQMPHILRDAELTEGLTLAIDLAGIRQMKPGSDLHIVTKVQLFRLIILMGAAWTLGEAGA